MTATGTRCHINDFTDKEAYKITPGTIMKNMARTDKGVNSESSKSRYTALQTADFKLNFNKFTSYAYDLLARIYPGTSLQAGDLPICAFSISQLTMHPDP